MVTIKSIAQKCGVSPTTVSKALNGYDDVNKETAQRILKTAEEMGYLPNMAARSLKTNRTHNLGILFSDQLGSGFRHEYFSGILNSFMDETDARGYDITFLGQHPRMGEMSYLSRCRLRNFDGVLIACADYDNPGIKELIAGQIPVVTIDYTFEGHAAAISDNVKGMRDLTEHVIRKGHRKIAYIHGEMTLVTQKRLASFYRVCEEYGINVPDKWVCRSRYRDTERTAKLTEEILSGDDKPTCLIFPDDYALIGGLNKIREMGLRVPDDISIAGYDGSFLSEIMEPRITTLKQDTDALGKHAAKLLIDEVEHPKTSLREHILVPGKIIPGTSVAELDSAQ